MLRKPQISDKCLPLLNAGRDINQSTDRGRREQYRAQPLRWTKYIAHSCSKKKLKYLKGNLSIGRKKGEIIGMIKTPQAATGIALLLFITIASSGAVLALPEGLDNITAIDSQTRTAKTGAPITAQGGNITWLNVSIRSQTTAWQGFVGNLSNSGLVLDDASGDRFYSWNLSNVSGEIYASRNASIYWYNIYPQNDCAVDEALTGRGSDRVSRTFTASANTVNFSVGTIDINSSTACSVLPFVNGSRQTTTNFFENIILNTATGALNSTIYAGILQADGTAGFDHGYYNFQLLVPVNRTTGFTIYYLYAEIE